MAKPLTDNELADLIPLTATVLEPRQLGGPHKVCMTRADLSRFVLAVLESRVPQVQPADDLIGVAQALEQRRALSIVEAVTVLAAGYHEGAFRAGFESACEEITLRLRTEVWDGCLPPVDAAKEDQRG